MKLLTLKEVQTMQLNLMKKLHNFFVNNDIKYFLIAGSALGALRHKGFIPWDDDIDVGLFREDYEKFLKISNSFLDDYEIINYRNGKKCDYILTRIYIKNTYIENDYISKTKLDKRLYLDVFPLDNVCENEKNKSKYERKISNLKKIILYIDYREYSKSCLKNLLKKFLSMLLRPFRNIFIKNAEKLMKRFSNQEGKYVCSYCSQYSFDKQTFERKIYGVPKLHSFEDAMFYVPEYVELYLSQLYGSDYMEIPPNSKRRQPSKVYLINEE